MPPWRKLLYIKQPYPDNYVDNSFLSQLKRNSTVRKYSFWQLTNDFLLISSHLSISSIVYIFFFGIYKLKWDSTIPVSISTLSSLLIYLSLSWNKNHIINSSSLKSSILIMLSILTLSPVLKSLSESTSSDSIWNLSFWLTLLNLIINDYHFDLSDASNISYYGGLSTNIIISNVVVLASRLNSTTSVFCFILLAFQIHGLFPILGIWLRLNHPQFYKFLILLIHCIINYFIWSMSSSNVYYLLIWNLIHFCLVILAPIYFLMLQQYKNELQGPWDPAKPIMS